MYKKQLLIQKIVCFLALGASVLVFLYALGIMTDLHDAFYKITDLAHPESKARNPVEGSVIFYDMQGFNKIFLSMSIVLILAAVLLFITSTQIRRRYYVSNVLAVTVNVVLNVGVAIWAGAQIRAFRAQFLTVDFAALQEQAEKGRTVYTDSTFWFDAHYVIFAVSLAACALLVANMVWKFILMKQEKDLLKAGKESV